MSDLIKSIREWKVLHDRWCQGRWRDDRVLTDPEHVRYKALSKHLEGKDLLQFVLDELERLERKK